MSHFVSYCKSLFSRRRGNGLSTLIFHHYTRGVKSLSNGYSRKHQLYFKAVCGGTVLWALYCNDWLRPKKALNWIQNWSAFYIYSEPIRYYKYVVIGTGEAAQEAVKVIRAKDPDSFIFLLSDMTVEESDRPSFRSLLSNCMEQVESREVSKQGGSYHSSALEPTVSHRVEKLDIAHNRILLSNGEWIRYGKLLLSPVDYLDFPRDWLVAKECNEYVHWRIWELDKEELNALVSSNSGWTFTGTLPHITVVGGGWYAVGYVCKLKQLGFPVTMVFPEPSILARYLPKYLCDYISCKLKSKGVDLVSYALIRYVSKASSSSDGQLHVHISRTYDSTNTEYFHTDYLFFVPTHMSSGLLRWSRDVEEDILELDESNGGILCNAELLAASDVYVAGSAVSFPNRFIGRRREQCSEHSRQSGQVVGTNMTGGREYYRHIPMTEIEFGGICMPMYLVGDIDSSYDCSSYFYMDNHNRQQRINDWNVIPTGGLSRHYDGVERGVVFFLRNSQVVGICLWNVKNENAYSIARSVVRDAVSASHLRSIALQLLCQGQNEQLLQKSSIGRTKHYNNHCGAPFHSSRESSSRHLTTVLDPKKNEILWETKDYFVTGRTQNDLKAQAFRKAILGSKFSPQR